MSIPNFTAQASLYRSSRHYRGSAATPGGSRPGESVVLSYRPLPATQLDCYQCNGACDADSGNCNSTIEFLDGLCSTLGWFYPWVCTAAEAGHAICSASWTVCRANCLFGHCCPKACGIPDPLHPGEGCCEVAEHCVDPNDPNSRDGCCPSDQSVCGGSCCAKGQYCCGDSCCPSGTPCFAGVCAYPPLIPPGTPPPPPPGPPPAGGCPPGTWYNPLFGCAPVIH